MMGNEKWMRCLLAPFRGFPKATCYAGGLLLRPFPFPAGRLDIHITLCKNGGT